MEAVAKLYFPGARSPRSQGQDSSDAGPRQAGRQRMGRAGVRRVGALLSPAGLGAPPGCGDAPGPPVPCCWQSPRAKLDGSRRAPLAAFPQLLPYALPRRTLPCRIRDRGLPGPARRAARPGLTLRNAAGGMCMQMRWMLISC